MGCYNIHVQIALVMVCVENGDSDMGECCISSAVTEGFLTIGWGDLE